MIRKAKHSEIPIVRRLFEEYQSELGIDLGFQDFDKELADLPGVYAEPEGCILVAEHDNDLVGVVAMKKIGEGISEMKRLYVRPDCRSLKLGKLLVEELISDARQKGYSQLNLDTLDRLASAVNIYTSMGFVKTEPYNYNPDPSARYFKLDLHG